MSPDTVIIKTAIVLRPEYRIKPSPLTKNPINYQGWRIIDSDVRSDNPHPNDPRIRNRLEHASTGIVMFARDHVIHTIRCSLPRVLWTTNGLMITSDELIREALEELKRLVGLVGIIPCQFIQEFSRVDIAWNAPIEPKRLLSIHRDARVEGIRATGQSLDLTNLRWHGSLINLSFYRKIPATPGLNKNQEIRSVSQCTRIELQLSCTRSVRQRLGGEAKQPVREFTISQCHKALAQVLLSFEGIASTKSPYSPTAALALLALNEVKAPGGLAILEWYRRSVKSETFRKTSKKVQRLVFTLAEFSWLEHVKGPRIYAWHIFPEKLGEEPFDFDVGETVRNSS